jgi:hypothetical protein
MTGILTPGKTTQIVSTRTGVGLGMFLAYLVACFTRGLPLWGSRRARPAGNALWLQTSDGNNLTALRLRAAEADGSRIYLWGGNPTDLATCWETIVGEVDRLHIGLVVIDHIHGLQCGYKIFQAARVPLLALIRACRARGCTLVFSRHQGWNQFAGVGAGWEALPGHMLYALDEQPTAGRWETKPAVRFGLCHGYIVEVGDCARFVPIGERGSPEWWNYQQPDVCDRIRRWSDQGLDIVESLGQPLFFGPSPAVERAQAEAQRLPLATRRAIAHVVDTVGQAAIVRGTWKERAVYKSLTPVERTMLRCLNVRGESAHA